MAHERWRTIASTLSLSDDVYKSGIAAPGWTIIKTSGPATDGFFAQAFSNGSEIVIAYRGSTEPADFYNVGILSHGLSDAHGSQLQDAINFYNDIAALPISSTEPVSFIGPLSEVTAYVNTKTGNDFLFHAEYFYGSSDQFFYPIDSGDGGHWDASFSLVSSGSAPIAELYFGVDEWSDLGIAVSVADGYTLGQYPAVSLPDALVRGMDWISLMQPSSF